MSVSKRKKVLQIDGVSYDAKTGKPLILAANKRAGNSTKTKDGRVQASAPKLHVATKRSKVLDRKYVAPKRQRKTSSLKPRTVLEGEVIQVASKNSVSGKKVPAVSAQQTKAKVGKLAEARSRFLGGKVATLRFAFSEFSKYGAIMGAVLLMSGYVLYLNMPNINLRVAANRAGFEPVVPRYSVGGYKLNRTVDSAPGIVTLQFGDADEGGYSITQRASDWDSVSLLNSHVERRASTYQTFQKQGLTLYIYNGNNATWVSGGVWYDLESDVDLNIEQILNIATSTS